MAMLSAAEIYTLARRAGFPTDREEAVIATAIALAESSGDSDAHNDDQATGDDSYGLWQINMLGALGPERRRQFGIARNEELFDPLTNARAARSVFTTAPGGFRPWSTFKNNRHLSHLGRVRQAAQELEASGIDLRIEGLRLAPSAGQELDVTEPVLRRVVSQEATRVLDHQARQVSGIASWERYLEVLLEAARRH